MHGCSCPTFLQRLQRPSLFADDQHLRPPPHMASRTATMPIRSMPSKPLQPFRFLDLPGEIRNKIYENILCSVVPREQTSREGYESRRPDRLQLFESPPQHIKYLQHSIEPNLLRTCQSIYDEGTYLMRKTNRFVKIAVKITDKDLEYILRGIPIIYMTKEVARDFEHAIVVHEIVASKKERARSFVLLDRDLGFFCKGLAEYNLFAIGVNPFHTLTLIEPCESQAENAPKFLTSKLQESLLAPYRSLRGFSHFKIKGAITKDLSEAAISEITGSWIGSDPELVLADLTELKLKGNGFVRIGASNEAVNAYHQCFYKILDLRKSAEGQSLREIGGSDFWDRVTALLFDVNSNSVHVILQKIRLQYAELPFHLQQQAEKDFYYALAACVNTPLPGSSWTPSRQQMAKMVYREAAGCRIIGDLERAMNAINEGVALIPYDLALQSEKERILRAMRR